ncbi:MAG: DUF1232 domain-containing protein [Desulfobulbaceae bacterium]|nr:MAG: DUF1232 domain-containing protein [Desulfobulbaceae bacterium]
MSSSSDKTTLILSVLKNWRNYLKLLFRRETPLHIKGLVLGAVIYLVFPFDVIPDWLLGFGIVDDFVVVSALTGLAMKLLDQELEKEEKEEKK